MLTLKAEIAVVRSPSFFAQARVFGLSFKIELFWSELFTDE